MLLITSSRLVSLLPEEQVDYVVPMWLKPRTRSKETLLTKCCALPVLSGQIKKTQKRCFNVILQANKPQLIALKSANEIVNFLSIFEKKILMLLCAQCRVYMPMLLLKASRNLNRNILLKKSFASPNFFQIFN